MGVLGIVLADSNLHFFLEEEIINISRGSRIALILCGGSGLIPFDKLFVRLGKSALIAKARPMSSIGSNDDAPTEGVQANDDNNASTFSGNAPDLPEERIPVHDDAAMVRYIFKNCRYSMIRGQPFSKSPVPYDIGLPKEIAVVENNGTDESNFSGLYNTRLAQEYNASEDDDEVVFYDAVQFMEEHEVPFMVGDDSDAEMEIESPEPYARLSLPCTSYVKCGNCRACACVIVFCKNCQPWVDIQNKETYPASVREAIVGSREAQSARSSAVVQLSTAARICEPDVIYPHLARSYVGVHESDSVSTIESCFETHTFFPVEGDQIAKGRCRYCGTQGKPGKECKSCGNDRTYQPHFKIFSRPNYYSGGYSVCEAGSDANDNNSYNGSIEDVESGEALSSDESYDDDGDSGGNNKDDNENDSDSEIYEDVDSFIPS